MSNQVMLQPSAEMRATIAEVAEELLPRLDEVAAFMARTIHDGIDELDEEMLGETTHSCRANVGLICQMVRDGQQSTDAVAPPEAVHYARECVRRNVPIDALLRAYRLGHQTFWQVILDALNRHFDDRDELARATAYCSDWTFGYVDVVSGTITSTYVQERERWVRSAEALRADEVRAILDGRPVDEVEAGRRLRYELQRRHVGLLVWGEDPEAFADGTAIGDYERVAQELCGVLGGSDVLCVPLGGALLAAWIGLREEPDLELLAGYRSPEAIGTGAVVAVGEPGEGLEGFRRTHQEAQLARRVSGLARRSAGSCARFSDVGLSALLTGDLDEARRFVSRELGGLAGDDDACRRLSATLRVFLEEGASFVRAARRLGVHENTIAYRVRRAGELLGHGIEQRQLELRVALSLADLLRKADGR